MPVTFYCKHCGKKLKADDKLVGRRTRCTGCREELRIPAESVSRSPVAKQWTVVCPTCETVLYPSPEQAGTRIRCRCGERVKLASETPDIPVIEPIADTEPVAGTGWQPPPVVLPASQFQGHIPQSGPGYTVEPDPAQPPGSWQPPPADPFQIFPVQLGSSPVVTQPPSGQMPAPAWSNHVVSGPPRRLSPEELRRERRAKEGKVLAQMPDKEAWRAKKGEDDSFLKGMESLRVFLGLILVVAGIAFLIYCLHNGYRIRIAVFTIVLGMSLVIKSS